MKSEPLVIHQLASGSLFVPTQYRSDGPAVSTGIIYQFCKTLSKNAELSIKYLEEELLTQRVVATDATPMTNNRKMCYIRNLSIAATVIYRAMKEKTLDAMHKLRFLENYTGILVHDHETTPNTVGNRLQLFAKKHIINIIVLKNDKITVCQW